MIIGHMQRASNGNIDNDHKKRAVYSLAQDLDLIFRV